MRGPDDPPTTLTTDNTAVIKTEKEAEIFPHFFIILKTLRAIFRRQAIQLDSY